jgi:hypothetical protein
MNGIIVVILFFILAFIIEKTINVKPTIDYSNKFEYVPIITANIYADLFIIFITFTQLYYNSPSLTEWYKKYRLSAMIADILIGVLYILLGRYLVSVVGIKVGLTAFAAICVGVQLVFDYLFFIVFSIIPKGSNNMLDFFKGYAKEVGINALTGDSTLVIFAVIASALLNNQSFDTNIVFLILSVYLAPFFIYMKD